ncbi:hypothetical protein [Nocardia beijingensis]|uniref:Uncharacterized protein n=1 Tax=Nocardia beijingensis TaxID=95162 RepID=A0ABW7W8X8_9NOCA
MAEVAQLMAVDAAGVLRPVLIRLGEPSVTRVELVGQGVFGSADDDYLSRLLVVREYLEKRGQLLCLSGRSAGCVAVGHVAAVREWSASIRSRPRSAW